MDVGFAVCEGLDEETRKKSVFFPPLSVSSHSLSSPLLSLLNSHMHSSSQVQQFFFLSTVLSLSFHHRENSSFSQSWGPSHQQYMPYYQRTKSVLHASLMRFHEGHPAPQQESCTAGPLPHNRVGVFRNEPTPAALAADGDAAAPSVCRSLVCPSFPSKKRPRVETDGGAPTEGECSATCPPHRDFCCSPQSNPMSAGSPCLTFRRCDAFPLPSDRFLNQKALMCTTPMGSRDVLALRDSLFTMPCCIPSWY